uniref:RNA-directed DNA polymerase n=1 Tax=Photinus pyralis TaxID=7054 RepID=A0A1Y1MVB1_PHOPY
MEETFLTILPQLDINILGKTAVAMIDTGAEISLISEKFIKENLGRLEKFTIMIKGMRVTTANQKSFALIKRKFILGFEVQGLHIENEMFVLAGMQMDCIIGADILRKHKGIINFEEGSVTIGKRKANLKMNEQYEKEKENQEASLQINHVEQRKISKETIQERLNCREEWKDKIAEVLYQQKDLINREIRVAAGYQHTLQVDDRGLGKIQTYSVPFHYRQEIREVLKQMIEDGIIERASTNVINPLVIVKKKNGTLRLCLDARELNRRTVPQLESPQKIEALLGKIGKNKIFTKLDLQNSFWLIPLEENSRKFTGFSVDGATFQFKVVPFGLASSCAALVRAMQQILDQYDTFCLHYVDDIIIFSDTEEEHLQHVTTILEKLNENGLKLHLEKCEFVKEKVKFLGFEINQQGLEIENSRLEEIKKFPPPTNVRKLRGFLGLLNYYRKFVPRYSEISVPLVELLKKGVKFKWTKEREEAFGKLKEELINGINLYHPDFHEEFILRTDASDNAVAGVLAQIQGGVEVPICFISRILRGPELNYSVSEKEMLAIIYCVTKLKFYLLGRKFTIETDHRALTHLMTTRFANNRIYRWSLILQEFSFEIKYIKGKNNLIADVLSRKGITEKEMEIEFKILVNHMAENTGLFSVERIRESQEAEELLNLRQKIGEKQRYRGYKIEDELLIKVIGGEELYVIDRNLCEEMGRYFHLKYGHIGIRRGWLLMRENFYCKRDLGVMKAMVNKCHLCSLGKYKNFKNQNEVKSIRTNEPLQIIAIDYLSNLVKSGKNKHILVIIDLFSRFTKLYLVPVCTTDKTVQMLDKFIEEVGRPKKIIADNATYFNNDRFKLALRDREIELGFCSIRHPQGNPSERYIQEVIKYLRIKLYNESHTNWGRYAKQVESFINEVPSTVTEKPPAYVMFGIFPERPWVKIDEGEERLKQELIKVREKVRRKQERYVIKENNKIKNRVIFREGDMVVLKKLRVADGPKQISAKLLLPYEGPYVINRRFGDSYELRFRDSDRIRGKFHLSMLYKYDDNYGDYE